MSELKEKGLGVFINLDKWGISTFTLKIIAMITMIIDHVGFLFFQDNRSSCRQIQTQTVPTLLTVFGYGGIN